MREVGLLCGTFNPVHWGHLLVAECARDQFGLEKVLFVTSSSPPHRQQDLLDAEKRHELVVSAVADHPQFEASRLELDRDGPSYTVDTLRRLHADFGPGVNLNLIVGADNVPYIERWHEADEIFKLCRILMAPRDTPDQHKPHGEIGHDPKQPENIAVIDFPGVGISSSTIRDRLRDGRTVLYMVPAEVNRIILANRFYCLESKPSRQV